MSDTLQAWLIVGLFIAIAVQQLAVTMLGKVVKGLLDIERRRHK